MLSDLIKNFLLSQFEAEATQVQFYTTIWLRMEQLLVSGNDQTGTFDKLFRAFLVKQGLERASGSDNKFDLYNGNEVTLFLLTFDFYVLLQLQSTSELLEMCKKQFTILLLLQLMCQVKKQFSSFWIVSLHFARNGNPNGPGLPEWPTYDSSADVVQIFDEDVRASVHPRKEQLDRMEKIFLDNR